MSGTKNLVILIGNLGQDPDIVTFNTGGRICNLSLATSESWKDKVSGEKKERTTWHRVVLLSDPLIKLAEQYLKKGDKIYIEGQLENRSWEKDGQKYYATEVVLRPYRGTLTMLTTKSNPGSPYSKESYSSYENDERINDQNRQMNESHNAPAYPMDETHNTPAYPMDETHDEIPF